MPLPPAGAKSSGGSGSSGDKKNFYDKFSMVIEGNLGADPENRSTDSKSIMAVNLGVSCGDRTEWFPVTFFDAVAEQLYADPLAKKGSKIGVIIQSRKTTTREKDGAKQYFTDWYAEAYYIKHRKNKTGSAEPAAAADAGAANEGGIQ